MTKTIAVSSTDNRIAHYLAQQGFHIIDTRHSGRRLSQIDAVLHMGYRPDMSAFSSEERCDKSVGSCCEEIHEPRIINITGMPPEQAAQAVKHSLGMRRITFS